ncbi:MAG TPA: TlpA disulfide reductase family protein, partial [Thermoanaerobaculia bacterium]|nr:TlpA disulfide reductase family protein [Thermoanaerobaculia bacterium]
MVADDGRRGVTATRHVVDAAALAVALATAACGEDRVRSRAADLVGRPAPALSIDDVIAGPEPEAWADELAGRAVVVDFWATWCLPCVEDLPRWNAMVDELAGEPVTFVTITDEPAAAVERFLEERRLAGWIGLDRDGSALDAFGVIGFPRAVLIDSRGVVRGGGHTAHVTPEVVRRLIAGEEPGLVPADGDRGA